MWSNSPIDLFLFSFELSLRGHTISRLCINLSLLHFAMQLDIYEKRNWDFVNNRWIMVTEDNIEEDSESDNDYLNPTVEEIAECRHHWATDLRRNKHRRGK